MIELKEGFRPRMKHGTNILSVKITQPQEIQDSSQKDEEDSCEDVCWIC